MVSGVGSVAALSRESGVPIIAHPALAGAARIAPPLILGKLFRLFGADATIFPECGWPFRLLRRDVRGDRRRRVRAVERRSRRRCRCRPGGMTVARVPEMRERFGDDAMLLIGGSLLARASTCTSGRANSSPRFRDLGEMRMSESPVRRFVEAEDGFRWAEVELDPLQGGGRRAVPRRDPPDALPSPRPARRAPLLRSRARAGTRRWSGIEHTHAVMVLRGRGDVLVGSDVHSRWARSTWSRCRPSTWHQFRASADAPLGFLCMVDAERDRPELPDARELERLRENPAAAAFLDATSALTPDPPTLLAERQDRDLDASRNRRGRWRRLRQSARHRHRSATAGGYPGGRARTVPQSRHSMRSMYDDTVSDLLAAETRPSRRGGRTRCDRHLRGLPHEPPRRRCRGRDGRRASRRHLHGARRASPRDRTGARPEHHARARGVQRPAAARSAVPSSPNARSM